MVKTSLALFALVATLPALASSGGYQLLQQDSLDRGLREAARYGRLKEVTELLEAGADPNHSNRTGLTPLMLASIGGNARVIQALLDAGAAIDARDDNDNTALLFGSASCNHRGVAVLIAARPNPKLSNHLGRTPLMEAADQGCDRVVKLLLQMPGMDAKIVNARDDYGHSAIENAREGQVVELDGPFSNITRMLRAAGAYDERYELEKSARTITQSTPPLVRP